MQTIPVTDAASSAPVLIPEPVSNVHAPQSFGLRTNIIHQI